MKAIVVTCLIMISHLCVNAQDVLVLNSGKRITLSKLDLADDFVQVVTFEEKVKLSFFPDSVLGYFSLKSGKSYYLKNNVELYEQKGHQFLERIEVGKINLYKKMSRSNSAYFYAEKDGRFENVFSTLNTGERKKNKLMMFASFMEDDQESFSKLNAPDFKFKSQNLIKAVEEYNKRNFVDENRKTKDIAANVILYRTRFQKIKRPLQVELLGEVCELNINDFVSYRLPVEHPSRLTITGEFVKTNKLLSADFTDQYFEVVYNKKKQSFVLNKKEGSELQFEFYKIKKKSSNN